MNIENTSQSPINSRSLALIGFGEAGQAFSLGWQAEDLAQEFIAFDIKTDASAAIATPKMQEYQTAGVTAAPDMATVLADAKVVFCLVTADQAQVAAASAAEYIRPGAFYFDGNSCAPNTKRASAKMINDAGGHYVDTAIMAPVHPKLHKTPILLSGPDADEALKILSGLGMSVNVEPGPVGRASSIKMIRSIMVKGMEALTAEFVLAGRRAGVEDIVLNSLEQSWPGFGWRDRTSYNLERMMVHGVRRAAEMREVAITIADLGLDNSVAQASVAWQQAIGELNLSAGKDDLASRVDTILAGLSAHEIKGGGK